MMQNPYLRLLAMALLSFISMYVLMYAMVDRFDNVLNNLNQAYMAGLMTAPMIIIELLVMKGMYDKPRLNRIIVAVSIVALIASFLFIRQQIAISDHQFLRSMIPHHAGAILMCENAHLQDARLKELCRTIISSQQSEIDQMKSLLRTR